MNSLMRELSHSYVSGLEVFPPDGKENRRYFVFQSTFKYFYSEARNGEQKTS